MKCICPSEPGAAGRIFDPLCKVPGHAERAGMLQVINDARADFLIAAEGMIEVLRVLATSIEPAIGEISVNDGLVAMEAAVQEYVAIRLGTMRLDELPGRKSSADL